MGSTSRRGECPVRRVVLDVEAQVLELVGASRHVRPSENNIDQELTKRLSRRLSSGEQGGAEVKASARVAGHDSRLTTHDKRDGRTQIQRHVCTMPVYIDGSHEADRHETRTADRP